MTGQHGRRCAFEHLPARGSRTAGRCGSRASRAASTSALQPATCRSIDQNGFGGTGLRDRSLLTSGPLADVSSVVDGPLEERVVATLGGVRARVPSRQVIRSVPTNGFPSDPTWFRFAGYRANGGVGSAIRPVTGSSSPRSRWPRKSSSARTAGELDALEVERAVRQARRRSRRAAAEDRVGEACGLAASDVRLQVAVRVRGRAGPLSGRRVVPAEGGEARAQLGR